MTCTFCFYLLPRRPLPFSFCTTACSNLAPVNCTSRGKYVPFWQTNPSSGFSTGSRYVHNALGPHSIATGVSGLAFLIENGEDYLWHDLDILQLGILTRRRIAALDDDGLGIPDPVGSGNGVPALRK